MHKHLEKLEELTKEIKKVYLVADEGIIKLLTAVIIANRMRSDDAVWLFLVAGSSGGKTEFIQALGGCKGIVPISSLTPTTFISGQRPKNGEEPSLLLKLDPRWISIFTFKDFTTILSMNPDAKREIIGQLREVYDGEIVKIFGTGKTLRWKGKVGFIAGATSVVYQARDLWASMGDRFLMYNMEQPDRFDVGMKAIANASHIKEHRSRIREAFTEYIENVIELPESTPNVSIELAGDIVRLADLVTRARSAVERDWRSPTKEIVFVGAVEGTPRMAAQLKAVAGALMIINGEKMLTESDYKIIYKLALDTITPIKRRALQAMAQVDYITTSDMAIKLNLSGNTARRALEELDAFEILDRSKQKNRDIWAMRDDFRQVIQKFDNDFERELPSLPAKETETIPTEEINPQEVLWADDKERDEL